MTTNAFIWRLEGREGRGPYNTRLPGPTTPENALQALLFGYGRALTDEAVGDYYDDLRHPAPWDDGITVPRLTFDEGGWRFGFCSLEEARAWWNEPRDAQLFDKAGVHLVAYDRRAIEKRALGEHQVAFVTPATPVARLAVCVLWHLDDETITQLAMQVVEDAERRREHFDRPPNRLPELTA